MTVKISGPDQSLAGRAKKTALSAMPFGTKPIEGDLICEINLRVSETYMVALTTWNEKDIFETLWSKNWQLNRFINTNVGLFSDEGTNNYFLPVLVPSSVGQGVFFDLKYNSKSELLFLMSRRSHHWISCLSNDGRTFLSSDKAVSITLNGNSNNWTKAIVDLDDSIIQHVNNCRSKFEFSVIEVKSESEPPIDPDELVRKNKHIYGSVDGMRVAVAHANTIGELSGMLKSEASAIKRETSQVETSKKGNLAFRIFLSLLSGAIAFYGFKLWGRATKKKRV